MSLVTTNPASGEQIATYDEMSVEEIGQIVDRAHAAWLDWKLTSFDERATLVRKLASLLREDKERQAGTEQRYAIPGHRSPSLVHGVLGAR